MASLQNVILTLAALAVVWGCTRTEVSSAPRVKKGASPSTPAPAAKLDLSRMPTVSKIDWSAFPDPSRFKVGRKITLQPGKIGVIAKALMGARSGDTILLPGGTYREGQDGDHRALPILRDGISIRAMPGQRARIVPRSGEVTYGLMIQASNILLEGLTIDGFPSVGIAMEKEGQTLKNIVMLDLQLKAPADGKWHDGIVVYHDNRNAGRPASDGLLLRKVTVENASLGISCNSGPCVNWRLDEVTVTGRGGDGSGADAIAVEEGRNMVFYRVHVSGMAADGIDLKAKDVLVMGCYVHNLARNGVKLWYGGDIVNTVIHHTGADAAIVFEHAGHYRILNSVMAFHNYPGPSSYNLTASYDAHEKLKVELINSIFYNTSGGMYFQDGTSVSVKNCLFHGMKNGDLLRAQVRGQEVELTRETGAAAFAKHKIGSGVILADPQFVNPAKGDFRLKRSSPAVNKGVMVPQMPAVDIAGAPRVKGGAPDIGAMESW